jgi:hypothetical protein
MIEREYHLNPEEWFSLERLISLMFMEEDG